MQTCTTWFYNIASKELNCSYVCVCIICMQLQPQHKLSFPPPPPYCFIFGNCFIQNPIEIPVHVMGAFWTQLQYNHRRWGGGAMGTRGLSRTGLMEMWKLGWMCMEHGSWSLTAAGLVFLWMGKGQMNREASFLDSTWRGRSCSRE